MFFSEYLYTSVIYFKCNITSVSSLSNTSWLNTETTILRFYSQWYHTWPGVGVLASTNLKSSMLMVYSTFFCQFKPFYCQYRSKGHFLGPRSSEIKETSKHLFLQLKNQCTHFFGISPCLVNPLNKLWETTNSQPGIFSSNFSYCCF